MAGRDNVTFVFSIENRKFMVKGKQMGAMLTDIQRSGTAASKGLQTVGNEGQNAGTKMAASAVNFQTATQGMLNLSTAAVQTFTSISNLDRANNRAKMSIIAVARAEDLLNNKETRLNDLRAQGITSGEKYRNMQREIATATADLTVKQEKQKIEQDAVNDVYMLFATNIANVTISSLQTVGVLLGQEKMARLGVVAATKLQSVVLSRHVGVIVASKAATGGHELVSKAMTFALIKQTAAQGQLTLATKMFIRAAWPLLAVTAAVTAAYLIYDNNVGGVKDAIDELMGVEKTHMDMLEEERSEVDLLNNSLDTHTEKIFKLPNTYAKAAADLKKLKNQIKETNEALKDTPLFREASEAGGKTTATGLPTLSIAWPMAFADNGGAHYDHQFDRFELFDRFAPKIKGQYGTYKNPFPQERLGPTFGYGPMSKFDFEKHAINIYGPGSGKFSTTGKPTAFTPEGLPIGTAGTKIQEEFLEFEARSLIQQMADIQGIEFSQAKEDFEKGNIKGLPNELQGIIRTHFEKREAVIQRLHGGGFVQNEIDQKTILAGLKQYTPESYALEQHRQTVKEQIAEIKKQEEKDFELEAESMHLTVKELQKRKGLSGKPIFVPGVGFIDESELERLTEAKSLRKSLLQGDLSSLPTDTIFDRLVKDTFLQSHKIGGSGKIFDTDELNLMFAAQDFSPSRKAAYDKYGVDIGKIGDRISKEEAERIGMLQIASKEFQGVGGRADAAIHFFENQGKAFRRMAMQNDIGSVSGGSIGAKTAFGRGFFKSTGATAAYQVPRGMIKTSAENRRRLDIRDANTNLLRFGGRLREGMTIEEEGAVVGGYSSVREFSAAARAQREIAWTTGKALAASFGQVMPSGYISGQGWKTHSTRLANRASEMKSALSSAGLSFKNVGYLDMGYRWTAQQANRAAAEHSAAVAYNNNQYAKATQINILEGGFDLSGFRGTSMDLPSLQDKVLQQDDLMKSIGLTRTEAFQIIDTQGRGREEIDDRVKWKSRLSSMSTGTAVL